EELSAEEKQELTSLVRLNTAALKARQEGGEQLCQAEEAVTAGRNADAAAILKALETNQFLSASDKGKAQLLTDQLRDGAPVVRGQSDQDARFTHPLLLGRGKLQQARQLMAKGNYDAAEALAREAEQFNANYHQGEDTPRKVLDDIARTKSDPKKLLVSARVAFQCGELDHAEKLAQAAEKVSGGNWSLTGLFGDSPAKVIKDVQTVRSRMAKAQGTSAVAKAPAEPKKDAPADKAETARELVKLGRGALQKGDLERALQYVSKAQDQKASLHWWEDNPTKLAADIQRAADKRGVAKGKTPAPAKDSVAAAAPKPAAGPDATAILMAAREQFNAGQIDEAEKLAQQAQAAGKTDWGLFDDSPEKVLLDIRKVHHQRDQEEAVRVLAEARKHYEKGDLEAALALAQRAEKM